MRRLIKKFLFMLKRDLCRGFCPLCGYYDRCREEIEEERGERG